MRYEVSRIEYKSSDGHSGIVAALYTPLCPVRGVVQIVHGMREYFGRYQEVIQFLLANGYAVCGNDHLGHGKTAPSRNLRGYFGEENGYRCLVKDVHRLHMIISKEYSDLPYILLGHSMGSFVVRLYLAHCPEGLDGAILSGTGGPNPMAKTAVCLADVFCRRYGSMVRPAMLERLAFGGYNRHIPHPRTPSDWLSRDTQVVDDYVADEYTSFRFTAAGFRDVFTLSLRANRRETFAATNPDLPILLFSGDQDPVGDYGRGVTKVFRMYEEAGCRDVTLKLYPGGRHEMLSETNRQEVWQDVLAWLEQRGKLNQPKSCGGCPPREE